MKLKNIFSVPGTLTGQLSKITRNFNFCLPEDELLIPGGVGVTQRYLGPGINLQV